MHPRLHATSVVRSCVCAAALVVAACKGGGSAAPPVDASPETEVTVVRDVRTAANAVYPEADPAFERIIVEPDALMIVYRAPPTVPVAVGNVLAGATGDGYLRRVTAIEPSGAPNTVRVRTTAAEITDLIVDGEFIVRQRAGSWEPANRSAHFDLFANLTAAQRCTGGATLVFAPTASATLDSDFHLDIADGVLRRAEFGIAGRLDAGVRFNVPALEFECEIDLVQILRNGGIAPLIFRRVQIVPLPGVWLPLVIVHEVEPVLQISPSMSLGEPIGLTASAQLQFELGAQYDGAAWSPVWTRSVSGGIEVTPPHGESVFSAAISQGISYSPKLYDLAGPTLDLGTELTYARRLGGPCSSSEALTLGVGASIGVELEVPILSSSIAVSLPIVESDVTLYDRPVPWDDCTDAGVADAGADASSDAGLDDGGVDGGLDDAATDASTTGPWIVALETGTLSAGPGGTGAGQVDLANAADFSPYPASAAGPFDTFGEVSLTTAGGVIPFAYHARAWSQTAGVPGTGYVTLKTTTFDARSSAAWTSGSPRPASSIWIMAAATNVFTADVTAPIATVAVTHRSASGVESVDEYVVRLGDHVRSYVRSTEFDYITDAPTSATEVYAGACANLGATLPECFLDAFEIPLTGPHALEPITSIRIHAERVFERVNLVSVYGSFRVHAITTMP